MKPPVCAVCGKKFSPGHPHDGGAVVKFANYTPLPKGRVGHPKGMMWICSEHVKAAKALTTLTTSEALKQLENNGNRKKIEPLGQ